MTVPATTRRAGPFNGNGSTTVFPFDFRVFAAADVQVTLADDAGVETVQVVSTDYTITVNADQDSDPGGEVTMLTAPATGETLVVTGAVDYNQTLDLPAGGNFSPRAVENAFDRTVIQIQQLAEQLGRSLTLPATAAGADTELPAPEANKVIGWNSDATALANLDQFDLAAGIAYADWATDVFSGTGAQTTFTLTANPGSVHNCDVSIGGVSRTPGVDFTVDGKVLTFTEAPVSGTGNVVVRYGQALPVGTVPTATTNWRVDALTGDGSTTEFTLTAAPFSANYTQVVVDGLTLTPGSDYTIDGTTITFTAAPPEATDGDTNILVRYGREVTDSADASGISYTAPSGVSRMVSERLGERVSVVDYGADPTGVTDSTAAIQLAINTLYANGGGEVWLPAGTYKTSAAISLRRHVSLVGPRHRIPTASTYGIVYDLEATIIGMARIVPTSALTGRAVIWDFQLADELERPYGASLHNILLDLSACSGTVDGAYCRALPVGEGVFDNGWTGGAAWMYGCVVMYAPRYGVFIESTDDEKVNLKLENCRVAFSGSHGINAYKCFDVSIYSSFSYANGGNGLNMYGCATERVYHNDVFNNLGHGIVLDGYNAFYGFNEVQNNHKHGYYIRADGTTQTDKRYRIFGGRCSTNSYGYDNTYDNIHLEDRSGTAPAQVYLMAMVIGEQAHVGTANRVRAEVYSTALPGQSPNVMANCIVPALDLKSGNSIFNDNVWESFTFDNSLDPGGQPLNQKYRSLTPWTGSSTSVNVLRGVKFFKTANVAGATLAGFNAGASRLEGREVWVLIDDANTAVDFTGTTLRGNGGVDLAAGTSEGKLIHFINVDGTNWAATIYG